MKSTMCVILLAATLVTVPRQNVAAGEFIAYSMNEAKHRLTSGEPDDTEVKNLGGICHMAGMVYDPTREDLILVGQVRQDGNAISLDDFIVAMRSVLVHNEFPYVSIDRDEDTGQTGKQSVRFKGGIEHTQFGKDLLEADIVLKNLSLGMVPSEVWGIESYLSLSAEELRREPDEFEDRIGSRFWFYPKTVSLAALRGVFAIRETVLGVETRIQYAVIKGKPAQDLSDIRDRIGDSFSQEIEHNLEDLGVGYPAIARLETLLDLVAMSKGVTDLDSQPDLGYWLSQYRVADVPTPKHFDLIRKRIEVDCADKKTRELTLSGGITLSPTVLRLKAGDVEALRDVVLDARPNGNSLTWNVPIEGWHIPGAPDSTQDGATAAAFTSDLGWSLDRSVREPGRQIAPDVSFPRHVFESPTLPVPRPNLLSSHQGFSDNIGGVMLSGTATVEGPDKAQVNLAGGNFALVVDGKNARIDPKMYRKFITALWCVYYGDQDPGISIDPPPRDPDEKKDPETWGKNEKHSVRYIGRVLHTDLGRVMREADYLMKRWIVGTEQPDYSGLLSVDRYAATLGVEYNGVPTRFWFVPEDIHFKRGGDLLLFDRGRIRLNTEYDQDGMRGEASLADEKFAEVFTQHYNDIAAINPIFQELFEYAKLVSLAKYLKEQGVPLHWFLMANKDLVLMEDSPMEVDGLLNHSKYVRGLMVRGGVNLAVTPTYMFDAGVAGVKPPAPSGSKLSTGLLGGVNKVRYVPTRFSFDLANQSYSVLPQHTLTSGKGPRGIRYQTDLAMRQNGRPGLELVRYFNPRNRETGQFGKGWHLLIPYRVKPAGDAKREFLNVVISKQMALENLCTGEKEVLGFSEDGDAGAGYVPERPSSSRIVRLLLMSDASYRLIDKLGNQFQFDQGGYLTDMFFSPNPNHAVHFEYVTDFTNAFEEDPYVVKPVDGERVVFRNVRVPKRVKVTDLLHGDSEVLTFSKENQIVGYVPENENGSRVQLAALLSNTGLQLVDKHGNETVFGPNWKFEKMLPSRARRMVQSVSMGNQKTTFSYTVDGAGEVLIAAAFLSKDEPGAPPTHVVRYEHDAEGRLCRLLHSDGPGLTTRRGQENDLAMARK